MKTDGQEMRGCGTPVLDSAKIRTAAMVELLRFISAPADTDHVLTVAHSAASAELARLERWSKPIEHQFAAILAAGYGASI